MSVWEDPQEYTLYKQELTRIQNSTPSTPATSSFAPTQIGNSPFITTISTPAPAVSTTPAPMPVTPPAPAPVVPEEPVKEAVVTWTTPEEARAAYESLLREKGITSGMSWKEAVSLIASDIRYTVYILGSLNHRLYVLLVSVNKCLVSL